MIASNYTRRNPAIDILRALTMILMVFVNDLWNVVYPHWMGHAAYDEDMLGLSDIVFPCFLFAVGMSIPYALENSFSKGKTGVQIAGHILTRTLALLIMGVFLVNTEGGCSPEMGISGPVYKLLLIAAFFLIWNVYPKSDKASRQWLFRALRVLGAALLIFLGIIFIDNGGHTLRTKWWGILGLIGWTYLVGAFIYFFSRDRLKYLIPAWIVFIIWSMLRCNTISTGAPLLLLPEGNALDAFAGILHIDTGAHCALALGGIILSVTEMKSRGWRTRTRILSAISIVAGLILLGFISNRWWIISKLQATAPWVFYCCAISVGVYAILVSICESGHQKWFSPVSPAGTATLTCYMMPYIVYALLTLSGIGTARPEWMHSGILGILSCLAFAFICVGLTWLLGKAKIKLKV